MMVSCKSHFLNEDTIRLTHAASCDAELQRCDWAEEMDVSPGNIRPFFRKYERLERFASIAGVMHFARKFDTGFGLPVMEGRFENRSSDRRDTSDISSPPGTEPEYGIETGNWYRFPLQNRTWARTKAGNLLREVIDPSKTAPFGPGSLFSHARRRDVLLIKTYGDYNEKT